MIEDKENVRAMMDEDGSPDQKPQITLNNSLLDCVDQYGNSVDQYSVLIESDNDDLQTTNKKQQISELNNPASFINTVTKDPRQYGSIVQEEDL